MTSEEMPTMRCPQCGREEPDFDGFGPGWREIFQARPLIGSDSRSSIKQRNPP